MLIVRITTILLLFVSQLSYAEPSASSEIFDRFRGQIFQIRIINNASDNKSVIGSGFQISPDGYVATNYHVISDYIYEPDKYSIEFLADNNEKGNLTVSAIDVVHDLAILKYDATNTGYLALNANLPVKGSALFSIGNPHDLGMTVVEGVHNGLVEKSFYQRILFSGSINSGMSGGPTFDSEGNVIGINVATAGNQLSFLVPARYLLDLYKRALKNPISDMAQIFSRIERQLLKNQQLLYGEFIDEEWPKDAIGDVITPGAVSPFFRCWGDSTENENDSLYLLVYKACDMEESIFINGRFDTGGVYYQYDWLTSDKMTPWQFYHKYSLVHSGLEAKNRAQKKDVGEFQCNEQFVEIEGHSWKSTFCIRQYKKFTQLYDLLYTSASLGRDDSGLVFSLIASGVTQSMSLNLVERFMEALEWKQ